MNKKNLLFVTPVNPVLNGRGQNLRAFQWVNYLSKEYNITVICTSVYGKFFDSDDLTDGPDFTIHKIPSSSSLFSRLLNMFLLRPSIWNSNKDFIQHLSLLEIPVPDVIMSFRLINSPNVKLLSRIYKCDNVWLDLDELNSKTILEIAKLKLANRFYFKAFKVSIEALLFFIQEQKSLHFFKKIFVSAIEEHIYLDQNRNISAKVTIFENKLPYKNPEYSHPGSVFKFLFVGNCIHFPNWDAINLITNSIVPAIKKRTDKNFRIVIVGGEISGELKRKIERTPEIEYHVDTKNLEDMYHGIHASLIPLRTGGGSSFKLLEALKYAKPVVSTSVGARGFNLIENLHYLPGNSTDEIADQCCRLIEDQNLAKLISDKGHTCFKDNHSYQLVSKKHELVSMM